VECRCSYEDIPGLWLGSLLWRYPYMSRRPAGRLARFIGAHQSMPGQRGSARRSVESRLIILTVLNAFLYWPWHLLRLAHDSGNHHPWLILGLTAFTLWTWTLLVMAIIDRGKDLSGQKDRES